MINPMVAAVISCQLVVCSCLSNNEPIKLTVPKTTAQKKTVTHQVRTGETLWDIARKHSVTIAQLQKWNNLDDPSSVRSGTTLKIIKN